MKESTIKRTALFVVLAGMIVLFLLVKEIDLETVTSIEYYQEEDVKFKGQIKKISQHEKVVFLEVYGERIETIKAIFFPDEDIYLKEGDIVELTGEVEEYQGEKEIIVREVVLK